MENIICNQDILGGKPLIKGTRIAVYLILDLLAEGYSFEEIKKLYPHVGDEDIKACVKYAAKLCQVGEISEPFGRGNYTRERAELLDSLSLDTITAYIENNRS